MIRLNNKKYKFTNVMSLLIMLVSSMAFISCEENELPETGSIPDLTPPSANFSYVASTADFKTILFTNLSASASDFTWSFGDGGTSTEANPEYTYAAGEGTYSVKLISKDGNDLTDEITLDVDVVDVLVPVFECPSFECSDRSVWGGGNASSPYSGSGSPTPADGVSGAKISANSTSRFLDQTILVSANTSYVVSFWYVSKSSGTHAGKLLIEDKDDNTAFINENVPLSANSSTYEPISYTFTTGATTENLRFFMAAGDVETRFDLVEIKKN
ncbi:PKD domain-containing protein [uncultured Polaribacter sp.]|uniref:PKD domain-containing protein n=1 Tax=uncultured Polaribacter sp. TaxID=174711 RepID=UPI00260E024B|nr:PKD domain-containing protein [uncultured Polaribacter sp.]